MFHVVTIDGPAGSGKSTVAKLLAGRLGWRFLDTGAMYRAVAWAGLTRGLDLTDASAVSELAASLLVRLHQDGRVTVDDQDVTTAIRSDEVTAHTKFPAGNAGVRATLVECQRDFARGSHTVTEGRDQGTVVFPNALLKVYLIARPEVRARRRHEEMTRKRQSSLTYEEVLADLLRRDAEDEERAEGPLRRAEDAVLVDSSDLEIAAVVERLALLTDQALAARPQG
jgi:cytidylate kinase